MGRPLRDKNKLAYFGPERLPGRPDGDSAGRLQCRVRTDLSMLKEIDLLTSTEGTRFGISGGD